MQVSNGARRHKQRHANDHLLELAILAIRDCHRYLIGANDLSVSRATKHMLRRCQHRQIPKGSTTIKL
jgi:hypothetical protein